MTPFFLAIQLLAAVEPVPPLTGPVVDLAEMIDGPHRAQLEDLARTEKESNGVRLQILTVPSIGDEPIEQFSVRVAEAWKIAVNGNDNGILIVVAKAERKFRIEVGGGLEGDLTDIQAKRILDDTLTPAFARGDYGGGLYSAAVEALRAVPGQQTPQPDVAGGGATVDLSTDDVKIHYGVGATVGHNLLRDGLAGLTPELISAIRVGLTDSLRHKPAQVDMPTYGPKVRRMMAAHQTHAPNLSPEEPKVFYALGVSVGQHLTDCDVFSGLLPNQVAAITTGLSDALSNHASQINLAAYGPQIQGMTRICLGCVAWKPAIKRLNELVATGMATTDEVAEAQAQQQRCLGVQPGDPVLPGERSCAQAIRLSANLDFLERHANSNPGFKNSQVYREGMANADTLLARCLEKRAQELADGTAGSIKTIFAAIDARAEATAQTQQAAANTTNWERLAKEHPELPSQAISAAICRTDQYRKWVLGQIEIDKKYSRIGGSVNLTKRYELQQLVRFLDSKVADATATLKQHFHGRPLSCSSSPVKALATCVVPPELLGQDEEPLARDPEQSCAYDGQHSDWYTSEDPASPANSWYLGSDWFQPTPLAGAEN